MKAPVVEGEALAPATTVADAPVTVAAPAPAPAPAVEPKKEEPKEEPKEEEAKEEEPKKETDGGVVVFAGGTDWAMVR